MNDESSRYGFTWPGKRKDDTSDDISAFDLIMRDKERLLSMGEPVRFIFSHSALREGWDNPNVFQICALRNSTSDIRRRQEVGRGLRLCVNQDGTRMDSSILGGAVQEINELTVIAGESYSVFAGGLQQEYEEVLDGRGENVPVFDTRKKRTSRLNTKISESPEFAEFWRKIQRKAVYSVNFDDESFVRECAREIDSGLHISGGVMVIERGKMEAEDSGVTFRKESRRTMSADPGTGKVKYDIAGRLAETTGITRKSVLEILGSIDRTKFAMYRANPDMFISEVARIILGVKESLSSERIKYSVVDGGQEIPLEPELDILRPESMTADTPQRGLYDITLCDSNVERGFASEADAEESLLAHAKLPADFRIPTPGGWYIPDWAVVMSDGRGIVVETKGTKYVSELRSAERAKIHCGEKFCRAAGIDYAVADSFTGLMSQVGGKTFHG